MKTCLRRRRTSPWHTSQHTQEAKPAGPEVVLTIEGDALDTLAIARFAGALRDAALFRDVELQSSMENNRRCAPSIPSLSVVRSE